MQISKAKRISGKFIFSISNVLLFYNRANNKRFPRFATSKTNIVTQSIVETRDAILFQLIN